MVFMPDDLLDKTFTIYLDFELHRYVQKKQVSCYLARHFALYNATRARGGKATQMRGEHHTEKSQTTFPGEAKHLLGLLWIL